MASDSSKQGQAQSTTTTTPQSQTSYSLGHGKDATASHASRTAETDGAFLLPHLQPHFHILDVGCGPGTITTSLARHVPQGRVVGIDMSPQVLCEAVERARTLPGGQPANVEFFCIDILAEGYSTKPPVAVVDSEKLESASAAVALPEEWKGGFDVIFESQVFVHLTDPVRALRNLRPLLKSGGDAGMFALRDYDAQTFVFHPDPTGYLTRWGPLHGVVARNMGGQSVFGGRDLHVYCRRAGLDVDRVEMSVHGVIHYGERARRWWGTLNAQRFEVGKPLRRNMVDKAGLSEKECDEMREALLAWIDEPDGVWAAIAFEVIARV